MIVITTVLMTRVPWHEDGLHLTILPGLEVALLRGDVLHQLPSFVAANLHIYIYCGYIAQYIQYKKYSILCYISANIDGRYILLFLFFLIIHPSNICEANKQNIMTILLAYNRLETKKTCVKFKGGGTLSEFLKTQLEGAQISRGTCEKYSFHHIQILVNMIERKYCTKNTVSIRFKCLRIRLNANILRHLHTGCFLHCASP